MKLRSLNDDNRGIQDAVNIVMALVIMVVAGAIGIFIADTVLDTTGTPAQANLSAMQTNILAAGQTGSSFVVILIIAFIGAVALGYIFMMSRQK